MSNYNPTRVISLPGTDSRLTGLLQRGRICSVTTKNKDFEPNAGRAGLKDFIPMNVGDNDKRLRNITAFHQFCCKTCK